MTTTPPPPPDDAAQTLSVPDLIHAAELLQQSGQSASIEFLYSSWLHGNPGHPLTHAVLFNYAVVLSDLGKVAEARAALEKAIALNPDFIPAYVNLGRMQERLGATGAALGQWSAALERLTPVTGQAVAHKIMALNQSARVLESLAQDATAENFLRQSLELDPRQREVIQHLIALRQRQCEWPVLQPSDRVSRRALLEGMSPLSAAAYADDPVLQLAIAGQYNRQDVGDPETVPQSWPTAANSAGPLRIGYLSSDLRDHAVGYLVSEIFGLHDRSRVSVYAYYCGPAASGPLHAQFQQKADCWRDIRDLDDAAAARQMADDGIHILVDLNGYTRDARVKLVARRPAPVIVNWLGFPGTMASPHHHYLIADDWIIPPGHEQFYTERVLRLPCYQPNNPQRIVAPQTPTRAEAGLPDHATVYCCFNGAHKLTPVVFERWLTILKNVPNSVLWLLSASEITDARLREYAVAHGVPATQLVFAPKLANPQHLARYVLADLFLDSMPYGAHTTSSDALWMGVPVLTQSGQSFASRVCGSLVRAAGVPELVCNTPDEYVARAIALGRDPALLVPLRQRLAANRATCTLFDMPLLVRSLEQLYEEMWQTFQQGQLPQPNLDNLEVYLEAGATAKADEDETNPLPAYLAAWRARLAKRHQKRPIRPDQRLWQ